MDDRAPLAEMDPPAQGEVVYDGAGAAGVQGGAAATVGAAPPPPHFVRSPSPASQGRIHKRRHR